MKLISNSALRAFALLHPAANEPLQVWRRLIEKNSFHQFAELKATFASVDKVTERYVFNIGGNKYRLIVAISFRSQICYVKAVMTHQEYDRGDWKP